MMGAPRRLMVIDRGSDLGIRVGQRLTLFRRRPGRGARPAIVGDAIVVAVRNDSATIRVERARDLGWRLGGAARPIAGGHATLGSVSKPARRGGPAWSAPGPTHGSAPTSKVMKPVSTRACRSVSAFRPAWSA